MYILTNIVTNFTGILQFLTFPVRFDKIMAWISVSYLCHVRWRRFLLCLFTIFMQIVCFF